MNAIVRTPPPSPFKDLSSPLRLALLGSTALVGWALLAGHANAQALPDLANAGGAAVSFNGAGDAMNVDLGGASRVIDFNSYNIAAGNSANYSTTVPSATDLVAVNRVITNGGGPSLIDGTITAGTGISVWLINQEGISYNGSASLGGGSLMLSTLDFAGPVDADFRAAFAMPDAANGSSYRFAGGSASSPIVIGGNLNVSGSIVAVGQQITTDGALTAANGSVVLVAASDVTFSSGLGNPLSFTVNAGTELGGAVNVNNALTGQSVIVAGGMQDSMTAALLGVNTGAALTATSVNGTVTLATASTGTGITIANGIAAAPSIVSSGKLIASASGGSVVVQSAGDITAPAGSFTSSGGALAIHTGGDATLGALTAGTGIAVSAGGSAALGGAVNGGGTVELTAGTDLRVGANVTAGDDYLLTARSIELGTIGSALTQSAVNHVFAHASSGNITGENGLTLTAGGNGAGNLELQADTGEVRFGADTALVAGVTGSRTDVIATSGPNIALGDVTAANLFTSGDTGLLSGGTIVTGDLAVDNALTIASAGGSVTTGNISIGTLGAALEIRAGGAASDVISTGTLATNQGNVLVSAGRDVNLVGGASSVLPGPPPTAGAIGLHSGGSITAGTLLAGGDIAANAASTIAVTTARAGDDIDFVSTAGNVSLGTAAALGSSAGGSALTFSATPGQPGAIGFGAEDPQLALSTIRLRSQTGNVTSATQLTATNGDILVTAAGDVLVENALSARGSIGLYGGGSVRGTIGALTAARDVGISANGDVQYAAITAGDDVDIVSTLGDVVIRNVTSNGNGTGGTSIGFLGLPGTEDSLAVIGAEVPALAGASIRLRAASGSILSSDTAALIQTQTRGDIVFNAANAVSVVDATAANGSIGMFAGTLASAGTLRASDDIGIQGNTGISVNRANAGDDTDLFSPLGDIVLNNAIGGGNWPNHGGTSVYFTGAAGTADAVSVGAGEEDQLAVSAIRLRAAIGDVVSSGSIDGGNSTDVLVNAARDVRINRVSSERSIGILAGGAITTGILTASNDVGVQGGTLGGATPTNITIIDVNARDDIEVTALNGNLSISSSTARGDFDYGGTSVSFLGAAGTAGAVAVTAGETSQFTKGAISLRSQVGDISSIYFATLRGDVLLNARGNIAVGTSRIQGGSLAVLAGGGFTGGNFNPSTFLFAEGDISVQAGTFVSIDNANARDDMDIVTLGGNLTLINGSTAGGTVLPGTSVVFSGAAGTLGALGTVTGEDSQSSGHTMRLRAEAGDIISAGTIGSRGGNVLLNAFGNAVLNVVDVRTGGATGDVGNVAILAGGSVSANALFASRDIGILSGTGLPGGISIGSAEAGDDIDFAAITGNITIPEGTSLGSANTGNTSVVFNASAGTQAAVGVTAGEDAQLTGATIRLRAAAGNISSLPTSGTPALTGKLAAQGAGDVLVNASGNASLGVVTAANGSIGVLAGGQVTAGTLTASRDIGVGGGTVGAATTTDVTITDAAAGDEIDITALNGNLVLTTGTTAGNGGASGTSVVFTGPPGSATSTIGAVGIAAEDPQFSYAAISLRSQVANVTSNTLRAQGAGNVLVNAAGDALVTLAEAANGSIGVLAGGGVTAGSLTAGDDIGVTARRDALLTTARAGDDIDVVAGRNLSLVTGTSLATAGSGGTTVTIDPTGAAAGVAGAVDVSTGETEPLTGSTIRLRAVTGDIAGEFATPAGTTLTTASGDILLNAGTGVSIASANAGLGSIGVLAGGGLTASTLVASRDIGVQGQGYVTIAAATAGDDIDMTSLAGALELADVSTTGFGAGGTSVTFARAAGTLGALGVTAPEDPQLDGSVIRLRAAAGGVIAAGTLRAAGDMLVNASGDLALGDVGANAGSIGLLAGGAVTATTLTAQRDIGVQAQGNVTIAVVIADDDIDMTSLAGTLELADVTTAGLHANSTSVTFSGAPGTLGALGISAPEDPQLGGTTIRLRAEAGSVIASGSLQAAGDVLVNAAGDVTLATVDAGGSVGILAGDRITAIDLTAGRDIGVQGQGNITIFAAAAGDDIDVTSLAGTLNLTDGTTTGLGVGGTSVTFAEAPGDPGALGISAPEDPQLGSRAIRLRAAAGDVISAGTLRSAGDVFANASGNVTLSTVEAAAHSIGVLAGGQATAMRLVAGRDIDIQAGSGATIADAHAEDDIDVVALAGNVSITNATSTGATGGGSSVIYSGAAGTANAVGLGVEDARFAGSTIRLRAAIGDVTSTGTLFTLRTGEVLVNAAANASLATVNAGGGSIGVLAGGQVTAATLVATRDIGIQGGTLGAPTPTDVTISDATAGDDLDVAALNGDVSLTNGTSTALGVLGSLVTFTGAPGSAAAVIISPEDAQMTGATIRLRSQVGRVTSTGALQAGTGNLLVTAGGAIALNAAAVAAGSIGLQAGGQVTAASLAAGRDVGIQAGAGITVGSAAAGDDIDMEALGGNLTLPSATSAGTAGTGGTSINYAAAPGAAASVGVAAGDGAQMDGVTIRLRAASGSITSAGTLRTQGTGDVLVNARDDLTLAAVTASAGSVALLAGGGLAAVNISASEDVAARAATNAAITTITAGDDIEIAAGGLVTTGAGTIGGTPTGLDTRHAVLDTEQAGQTAGIAIAAGDTRGPNGLPTGSALANAANGRNIVIEAADIDMQDVLTSSADGRITLRNTGTGPTLIGNGTVTTDGGFAVGNAELDRLKTGTLVVDSGSQALELGTLTIDAATGTIDTRFLATGDVEITGALTVAGGAQRTLQIGGLLGQLGDDAGTVPLAASLIARIDRVSRPRIDAGAAHVDLRAAKILFGTSAMVNEYIGMTNDQIAAIVANPASKLYSETAAQPPGVFLTAKRVTVGYRNFALFQNTDVNRSTGVLINSPTGGLPDQTALALRLVSTGEEGNNSFAMFGVVNNFNGTPAALLTNEAIEIVNPTGDPNDFRVTRASSRINGCVIGSPDRACLANDIRQPNFNLYDERKVALFDIDDETTIAISPLIGPGNDGLIVNVADAPIGIDTIECRPDDSSCPAGEGK